MKRWSDIVKVALLGTERGTLRPAISPDPADELLRQLGASSAEHQLLATIATRSLYQQVGQTVQKTQRPLPSPAPLPDLPRCGHRLGQMVREMIQGKYHLVLPEGLSILAATNQRVPEELLPNLLSLGLRQPDLHPLLRQTIGQRGHWLAAQHTSWSYAHSQPDQPTNIQQTWKTGTLPRRKALLQQLRTSDPDQTRRLIQSTWETESARDRSEWVTILSDRLTMADEPFLEGLLDDPSYAVRRKAIDLLGRLTESRLSQRMATRARPMATLHTESGSPQLTIEALETVDEGLLRDGVLPKASAGGLNAPVWRTAQMLGSVPLAMWVATFQATPAELVQAAMAGPTQQTLIRGWVMASRRQQDAAWAEALLFYSNLQVATNQVYDLVPILPIVRREAFALTILEQSPGFKAPHQDHPLLLTLKHLTHPWSQTLARAVLTRLAETIAEDRNGTLLDWKFREAIKRYALYFPPLLLDEVRAMLQPAVNGRVWQMRIDEFIDILNFRRDLLAEIEKEEDLSQ